MKNKLTLVFSILAFITYNSLKAGVDTSKCIWAQNVGFAVWDTCQGSSGNNSLNGNVSVKGSCLKYAWSVNGVLKGTGYSFHYPITANGSYAICVKVTDTCNKCDTTLCSTRNISCFGGKCNWKSKSPNIGNWDSCHGSNGVNSINSYISFGNKSCLKYAWSVNGKAIPGNLYYANYPVTSNGSYQMCVKVTDTCNKCDTTYCSTHNITCFGSKCNWSPQNVGFATWDSCQGSGGVSSLNGSISVKGSCLQYAWSVNGVLKGSSYSLHYPITSNGSYLVCMKVTDTCHKCDTTFCRTFNINCHLLSAAHITSSEKLNLYPNPAGDMLGLDWSGNDCKYMIISAMGAIMQEGTVSAGSNQLKVATLPEGVYFIQLQSGSGLLTRKLVIHR